MAAKQTTAEKLADLRERLDKAQDPGSERSRKRRDDAGRSTPRQRINALLEQAAADLADPGTARNEYYAFVCEKCAPGFSYYGWFQEAEELEKEAKQIRERLGAVPGVF